MAHNYQSFLINISHLLLPSSSEVNPTPPPYILQLHPGIPTLELGAVSSLYELSFNVQPEPDLKTELSIEAQLCRNFFLDTSQEAFEGDLFLGMDAVWVERYEPAAPDSPTQPKPAISSNAATLLIITEWTNPDAEKVMHASGKIEESRGGPSLTAGEYFDKNLLRRGSAWKEHQVVFENVSASNVQWLDKEEKWSTYVQRLMDEAELRKAKY